MAAQRELRLLVVEDDPVDRTMLNRLLKRSSLAVAEINCVDRVARALECVGQSSFDVILLDLGLPDSEGMDAVMQLQAEAPDIPIIVLTGLDDEEAATRAVQKGVQDFLVKGQVDGNLLVRSIRYALERKKAERELQLAEQRYRTIFENSAVAIMMVDREEHLVSWNSYTERLLGAAREDLLGRDLASLCPPSVWEQIRERTVHESGISHHHETQMVRKDGRVIEVDISLTMLHDSDGDISGSICVVRDITERKHMEEALRRSEKRFRQVAENAKEWIWEVDADGCYTYSSPLVEQILGYTPEEILGHRRFHDFFHPEDARQLQAEAAEIFKHKDVFTDVKTRNLHKDGTVVWLQRSGVPILRDNGELLGYRGSDVDITEGMRTHEILDRKQKNLEAIFDAAPFGMLLVNENDSVVRANDTIRQMSGKQYKEILGANACQALACAHGEKSAQDRNSACGGCHLHRLIKATLESGEAVYGVEVCPWLNDSGEEVRPWLSVSVVPVEVDGGKHVVVALDDVTDRRRAEEQLTETMELKSQFISTVSHELRTPLTAIREAVTIVADGVAGKVRKDQKHFLDLARRNIDRLARLIDNVLDFQKLIAGKMEFHLQPNVLVRTVEDAYTTMLPHARNKQVQLTTEVEADLPPAIYDSDRMMQVLTNLISNAIKFTPETGTVSVSAQRRAEEVVLRISDTGMGIPKEALPKIFNRFYRVRRPGKEIKGTGLGLAIVHKIVAGHGGRIDVESEVDKGTTFSVVLPLVPQRADADALERADACLETELAKTLEN